MDPAYPRIRTIALPGMHDVNVVDIKRLLDHPLVQRMRHRAQLGYSTMDIFVGAATNRLGHSLSVFQVGQERGNIWSKMGICTEDEAWNIALDGLLHDIGHGPLSHESEALCKQNHNQVGLELLNELAPAIADCDGDFETVRRLFTHEHPLHVAISHNPLGADKLCYLWQDSRNTNDVTSVQMGPVLNYCLPYRDGFGIQLKIIEEVLKLQQDYLYMYFRIYLRKACLNARRMIQKAIWACMTEDEDPLQEIDMQRMVDAQLMARLQRSSNPSPMILLQRFWKRHLPKSAVVIRPEGFTLREQICNKAVTVFTWPWEKILKLDCLRDPVVIQRAEENIAQIVGLAPHDVTISSVLPSKRFTPADIHVFDYQRPLGQLSEFHPKHYEHLSELTKSHCAVRVCVPEMYRDLVSTKYPTPIAEYLETII